MKNKLTQKEIFYSNDYYEALVKYGYGFTKDINKDELAYALESHIIGEHDDYKEGVKMKDSSDFFENHLLHNTTFAYEYDGQYIGLYEYEGGVAIIQVFQGYEVHIIGSSIVNFFHEILHEESADEMSAVLSDLFNIKFEMYEDDERYAIDEKIKSFMNFDEEDYCKKYPDLMGYFNSNIDHQLYLAFSNNHETFNNNIMQIDGNCTRTTEKYFIGDFACSSGWIDRGYGHYMTLLYPLDCFSKEQIKEIKTLMGKCIQKYDKYSGQYEGFNFTLTINYEIDSNKVVKIKNTTIEKYKEN